MRTNRMRIPVAILAATLALSCTSIAAAAEFTHPTFLAAAKAANHIPAFPGAEGAGMYSLGGRGGKVYEVVRTTDDSEPGSFRYALEAEGPRTVVFRVGGILMLERPLSINNPYITIAGQTAPGDGVCVRGHTVNINTHDVIIRHMRFRRGNLVDRDDSLGGHPVRNIIIDHCSVSWGGDETLSLYRHRGEGQTRNLPVENLTIQWTIISESLRFGGTWGGNPNTFHHNLFASNSGRNPSIGMGGPFNFYNNVIFNWRHRTADGGNETTRGNFISNYYKPGPATNPGSIRYRIVRAEGRRPTSAELRRGLRDSIREFGKWYVAGNIVEGNETVTADNWAGGVQFPVAVDANEMKKFRADKPFPAAPVRIVSAEHAFRRVLESAGATLPVRDAVDRRIIEQVISGQTTYNDGMITDPAQVGGWPEYRTGEAPVDTDRDGMPDKWEKANNLDPNTPSDGAKDTDGDGFTNLEEFLNGTNPNESIDYRDPKNNIDTISPVINLPGVSDRRS